MTWTPEHVLARLIEAVDVISLTATRDGPRGHANGLPDYAHSFSDQVEWDAVTWRDIFERKNKTRLPPSPQEISRADEAMGWLPLIETPEMRKVILFYASSKAFGWNFSAWMRKNGLVSSTTWRKINKCLQKLAQTLDSKGISLSEASDLHVRAIRAKTTPIDGTVPKCATNWKADGARPEAENFGNDPDPNDWARKQAERRKRKKLGAEIEEEYEQAPAKARR